MDKNASTRSDKSPQTSPEAPFTTFIQLDGRSADRLLAAITSFQTALTWPETQQRIQTLLERGLQRDVEFEKRWPELLGTRIET